MAFSMKVTAQPTLSLAIRVANLPKCSQPRSLVWSCRFFIYIGYLILLHQMGIALFRLMGALGRDVSVTNVYGSFVLVLVILLGGFALKRPDIHPWWIWMFWVR